MAQPPLTGLFAERYLIERELGHGATAVVYLAKDTKHGREIALKVLSKDLAHALGPERFLREIHVTSRLQHPHILPIFDSGESNGLLYYVMPRVSGESLREKIDSEKQLPLDDAVRITCEVAEALAHAHATGVIHRDVKPENIMLSDGHALLADFGIARALDVHTGERLTSSGLIVGTSAYMSPEQASGEERIDARSDIYCLACVLYEMLAGVQPFTGPTTQAVIAQRFTHAPRPVTQFRPAVPEHIQHALEKAFSVSPADRQQSVRQFAAELGDSSAAAKDRRRSPLRRLIYGRQKTFGFAAAALAVAGLAFIAVNPPGHWSSPFNRASVLDTAMVAVIPVMNNAPGTLDMQAADGIYRGLDSWNGLPLVDPAMMSQRSAASLPRALELARQYHAGKVVVTGEFPATSGLFTAAMYDVQSSKRISAVEVKVETPAGQTADVGGIASAVASQLMRIKDFPQRAAGGERQTASLAAWTSYQRAHSAIDHGDFHLAQQEFAAALAADESFAPARVWSAQVGEWLAPLRSDDWIADAQRAGAATKLDARDQLLAEALGSLATKDFLGACAKYRKMIAGDSSDFGGWLGLGDCQTRDDMILPYKQSASGFRFRASHRPAIDAFRRAVEINPVAYDIVGPRMNALEPTAATALRVGHDSAGARYYAFAALDHDTLAFVPYPQAVFATIAAPPTRRAALDKDLSELVQFAINWVRALPRSARGFEALSQALEARGDVDRPNGAPVSASGAVAQALRLSTSPMQRVRLTEREIRLRVKRGEFARASALADSLLGASRSSDSAMMELGGIAGMTGHIRIGSRWAAVNTFPASVESVRFAPQVIESADEFLSRAAMGDCTEKVRQAEAALQQRMHSYLSDRERELASPALLTRSYSLLTPCTRGQSALKITWPADRLARMQQAYARNDILAVRRMLDSSLASRKLLRASDRSTDVVFQEAWLRAAMGDTAGAITQLDQTLDALPSISEKILSELGGGSALPRAMMLRAELAYATKDIATAKRYAGAVAELWANADPELQPMVARMKRMAAGGH